MRRVCGWAVLPLLLLVATPGALAESVVYVRDHKPWVMNLDGTGQRSLGLYAAYASSYFTSVAMADDGTVLAGLKVNTNCGPGSYPGYPPSYYCDSGDRIVRIAGGAETNLGNPLPCARSLSNVDMSPDGRLMAFQFGLVTQENCAPADAPTYGIAITEAKPGGAVLSFVGSCSEPSFIDNTRVIAGCHGPTGIHIITAGQNASAAWVETQSAPGYASASRDFSHIAWTPERFQRDKLNVWSLAGAPPAQPTGGCTATNSSRFTSPSWAADNRTVVYSLTDDQPGTAPAAGEGVWTITEPNPAAECAGAPKLLDPLGDDPDVGGITGAPTPVSAQPGAQPSGPPTPASSGEGALGLTAAFRSRQPLRSVVRSGLRASIGCDRICSVAVEIRLRSSVARRLGLKTVVARKGVALQAGAAKKVTVRMTSSARRKLVRERTLKLIVVFTATGADGKSAARRLPLTLRR